MAVEVAAAVEMAAVVTAAPAYADLHVHILSPGMYDVRRASHRIHHYIPNLWSLSDLQGTCHIL